MKCILRNTKIYYPLMFLDYSLLEEQLSGLSEIHILASKKYVSMVKEVYDTIINMSKDITIFIINSDDVVCSLKHGKIDYAIILGVECPEHTFTGVRLKDTLTEEEMTRLSFLKNVIYDSTFSDNITHCHGNEECVIVTRNNDILQYYNRKMNVTSFFDLLVKDNMQYLTRRINIAEIARNKKIFAIVFIHEVYKELANKIKLALESTERYAYLLYLRNIRQSRLITVENIDAIILIDCPVFDNFDIDVTLPILSPADVQYLLTSTWSANYDINNFNYTINNQKSQQICKHDGAGKYILDNEFFGIQYTNSSSDLTVYEGRKGTSEKYENE